MRIIRLLVLVSSVTMVLAACATESYYTSDTLRRDSRAPRILVMPPDVELFELDSTGTLSLNPLWTQNAGGNVTAAIRQHLEKMQAHFVEYTPPADENGEQMQLLHQAQKLHATVGTTIRNYQFDQTNRLPTKNGRFDWGMGPGAEPLARHADADYALFLWVRDSYSTGDRKALQIALIALAGVNIGGGIQQGHASLVDLRTGQVVWFNALRPRQEGDLRTAEDARSSVALLLDKLPK